MQVTLKRWMGRAIAAMIVGSAPLCGVASADSAYIPQIPVGTAPVLSYETAVVDNLSTLPIQRGRIAPNLEYALPHTRSGNLAQSITIGAYNQILQIQTGFNDASSASIVGGIHDGVAVLQAGSNLRSNIGLIGLENTDIGVLQGNGAPPLNLLMARLPNGRLLIVR